MVIQKLWRLIWQADGKRGFFSKVAKENSGEGVNVK